MLINNKVWKTLPVRGLCMIRMKEYLCKCLAPSIAFLEKQISHPPPIKII